MNTILKLNNLMKSGSKKDIHSTIDEIEVIRWQWQRGP
jgi:hypothetical protein